jgi:hypothetical protein
MPGQQKKIGAPFPSLRERKKESALLKPSIAEI